MITMTKTIVSEDSLDRPPSHTHGLPTIFLRMELRSMLPRAMDMTHYSLRKLAGRVGRCMGLMSKLTHSRAHNDALMTLESAT